MSIRRAMLLLKPFDSYRVRIYESISGSGVTNPKILQHAEDRLQVHKDAISFCQDVLKRKLIDWETFSRDRLSKSGADLVVSIGVDLVVSIGGVQGADLVVSIGVDLVVSIGGDGTLLQASHFMDGSIPILGVNSDPTQVKEVLDDIVENDRAPSELSRMSISINSQRIQTPALNDILAAHPCPATASRFSFRCNKDGPLVNSRSSGLRVSTATGSTAAMLSAGGFAMPILSRDLQDMVREPVSPSASDSRLLHGLIKDGHTMEAVWCSKEGAIYIDGSSLFYPLRQGDAIEISLKAPALKVFLPDQALSCRL